MQRTVLACVILALVTLAAYWPATTHGYVDWDDPDYVTNNPFVSGGLTEAGITGAFRQYDSNWHPLTWMSLMLDVELWSINNPGGFHFTNIVLHIVNVLLLFILLKRMTRRHWPSVVAAGLFALHPVHVESVAWIAERKDVLSAMFWLLTMLAYVWYVQRPGFARYVVIMLAFALALMSKSMVITLPAALLLLDVWPLQRLRTSVESNHPESAIRQPDSWTSLLLEKIPLLAMSVALAWMAFRAQRPTAHLEEGVWIPLGQRLTSAALGYVRYLGILFWPKDLAMLYPNPNLLGHAWPAWKLAGSMAALAVITLLIFATRRTRPYLLVGWLWFIGTMLTVSGIVQFGRQAIADRYAYIPFIGLYVAIAWLGADVASAARWRMRIAGAMALVAGAALFAITSLQVTYWRDSLTLFSHTLAITDDNWMMHRNVAGLLDDRGQTDDALAHMTQALAIFPNCGWLHDHYAAMLAKHDHLFQAQQELERAIELDPTYARAHFNLAVILYDRGRGGESAKHYEKALEINPHFMEAYRNLAMLLSSQGRKADALHWLERAKISDPANVAEYNRIAARIGGAAR